MTGKVWSVLSTKAMHLLQAGVNLVYIRDTWTCINTNHRNICKSRLKAEAYCFRKGLCQFKSEGKTNLAKQPESGYMVKIILIIM